MLRYDLQWFDSGQGTKLRCCAASARQATALDPSKPSRHAMRRAPHSVETYRASLHKIHELDDALELMYFGWRGMTRAADEYLATLGLSRAHHRILYVIARRPGISVGSLVEVLGISKQALNRPLNLLLRRDLVISERSAEQHRSKLLGLTEEGKRIENRASGHERRVMKKAFDSVGLSGADAWKMVMKTIAEKT